MVVAALLGNPSYALLPSAFLVRLETTIKRPSIGELETERLVVAVVMWWCGVIFILVVGEVLVE